MLSLLSLPSDSVSSVSHQRGHHHTHTSIPQAMSTSQHKPLRNCVAQPFLPQQWTLGTTKGPQPRSASLYPSLHLLFTHTQGSVLGLGEGVLFPEGASITIMDYTSTFPQDYHYQRGTWEGGQSPGRPPASMEYLASL